MFLSVSEVIAELRKPKNTEYSILTPPLQVCSSFEANRKGEVFSSIKQYKIALKYFARAVELDDKVIDYWINLAMTHCLLKNFDDAYKAYLHALELDPLNAKATHLIGDVLFRQGNYIESLQIYLTHIVINEFGIRPNPDIINFFVKANKHNIPINFNNYFKSLFDSKAAFGVGKYNFNESHYATAIKYLTRLIEVNPNHFRYWRQHEYAQCLSRLTLKPKNESHESLNNFIKNNPTLFNVHGDYHYYINCQYQAALQCYEKAIELNPMYSVYWHNKAEILTIFKRYNEAHQALDTAYSLNTDNDSTLNLKGLLYLAENNSQLALEYFDKAIAIESNHAQYLLNKALVYLKQNSVKKIEKIAKKITNITYSNLNTQRAQSFANFIMHCSNWLTNQKPLLAKSTFFSIYEKLPTSYLKSYLCCDILAEFYFRVIDKQWLSLTTDQKLSSLGSIIKLQDAYIEIINVFAQLIKDTPHNAKTFYYYARLLLVIGDKNNAQKSLKRCQLLAPYFLLDKELQECSSHQDNIFPTIKSAKISVIDWDKLPIENSVSIIPVHLSDILDSKDGVISSPPAPLSNNVISASVPNTTDNARNTNNSNPFSHEQDSQNKIVDIKPQNTAGMGDCAFHATFGTWKNNLFVCNDVKEKRTILAEEIKKCRNNVILFDLVKKAIQALIMERSRIATGDQLAKTTRLYNELLSNDDEIIKAETPEDGKCP